MRALAAIAVVSGALAVASAAGAGVSPEASCVGQFVAAVAPQNSGAFGQFVQGVAQTTEPNLGLGDVAVDATAPHDQCS
jgi:hypothetical protein